MFDHLSGNVLQRFWLYIPLCLLSCANPNVWFSVMKLTLMVKLRTLLSSHRPPLLEHPILPFVCSIALRKRHTKILTVHCHDYHCALNLTCQNSPWWWSCEWCNNFCLRSGHYCSLACLTRTAWTSCFIMLYCPWNPVLYKVTWFPTVCLAIIWLPKTACETAYSISSCTCWGSPWGWEPAGGNFFGLGHAELVLQGRTWHHD